MAMVSMVGIGGEGCPRILERLSTKSSIKGANRDLNMFGKGLRLWHVTIFKCSAVLRVYVDVQRSAYG